MHHTPRVVTPHGYDLVSALAVSHTLLDPAHSHALTGASGNAADLDDGYLKAVEAPFDWEEAQRRVQASAESTN
jgi:hypothetical protein